MSGDTDPEDARRLLERAGITVPPEDLAFLQRTLLRQREVLSVMRDRVAPETEPAHVFRAGG